MTLPDLLRLQPKHPPTQLPSLAPPLGVRQWSWSPSLPRLSPQTPSSQSFHSQIFACLILSWHFDSQRIQTHIHSYPEGLQNIFLNDSYRYFFLSIPQICINFLRTASATVCLEQWKFIAPQFLEAGNLN